MKISKYLILIIYLIQASICFGQNIENKNKLHEVLVNTFTDLEQDKHSISYNEKNDFHKMTMRILEFPEKTKQIITIHESNLYDPEHKKALIQSLCISDFMKINPLMCFAITRDNKVYYSPINSTPYSINIDFDFVKLVGKTEQGSKIEYSLNHVKNKIRSIYFLTPQVTYENDDPGKMLITSQNNKRILLHNAYLYGKHNRDGDYGRILIKIISKQYDEVAEKWVEMPKQYIGTKNIKSVILPKTTLKRDPKTGHLFPPEYIYNPYTMNKLIE